MNTPGYFLCLEGCDGTGKTSVIHHLKSSIQKQLDTLGIQRKVLSFRTPGDETEPICRAIRDMVVNNQKSVKNNTMLLLMLADMEQLLSTSISDALNNGDIVLCDRLYLSTLVYQSYIVDNFENADLIMDTVDSLFRIKPNRFIILDSNVERVTKYIRNRGADDDLVFSSYQKILDGYHFMTYNYLPVGQYQFIDATCSLEQLYADVDQVVLPLIQHHYNSNKE